MTLKLRGSFHSEEVEAVKCPETERAGELDIEKKRNRQSALLGL